MKTLIVTVCILGSIVVGYYAFATKVNGKSVIAKTHKRKSTGDKQIDSLLDALKKSMENYMKDYNPPYSQQDIDECVSLLTDYTISTLNSHSKGEGRAIAKSTVLKLNALNAKCDHSLIETSEREQIAAIIILAGHRMKYNSMEEDITEEWREW